MDRLVAACLCVRCVRELVFLNTICALLSKCTNRTERRRDVDGDLSMFVSAAVWQMPQRCARNRCADCADGIVCVCVCAADCDWIIHVFCVCAHTAKTSNLRTHGRMNKVCGRTHARGLNIDSIFAHMCHGARTEPEPSHIHARTFGWECFLSVHCLTLTAGSRGSFCATASE